MRSPVILVLYLNTRLDSDVYQLQKHLLTPLTTLLKSCFLYLNLKTDIYSKPIISTLNQAFSSPFILEQSVFLSLFTLISKYFLAKLAHTMIELVREWGNIKQE